MGYNLPPGVSESDLPGFSKEDEAWDKYWDTDRPEIIFTEVCPEYYHDDMDDKELLGYYDRDSSFKEALDKDFQSWCEEPDPNDDRL